MTARRRYPGEPRFPNLAMIGRIKSEVERASKLEREKRYYTPAEIRKNRMLSAIETILLDP